jgi:hypothetical protein
VVVFALLSGSLVALPGVGHAQTVSLGFVVPVGSAPQSVATGDFNGDGRLDLAVANGASNDVTILLGHGGGGFTEGPAAPSARAAGRAPSRSATSTETASSTWPARTAPPTL